ncbi:MAG TPA: hypothetical protein VKB32_11895 [Actinomycetota bacterium]|nr:hypothetical protein [Actinomycetota bacterium]
MNRSPVRHRRAVLVLAIANLTWAAVSAVGERPPASSGAAPSASTTVQAFTSMPVVASDRPSTLLFVRRAERTQTAVTTPAGLALAHPSALVREAWPTSASSRIVPLALHLAGRGPPLLAAA